MFFLLIPRDGLLKLFPTGGQVAEIGTFQGEFAEEILKTCRPDRLFLIDPWEHQEDQDYAPDPSNVSHEEHQDNLELVQRRFDREIKNGQVQIVRAYSRDAAKTFEAGSLDWVYIDGIHTFDGVWADLTNYASLLNPGGFIAGHDYNNGSEYAKLGFGVVEAVNTFARDFGYQFICLTYESVASYVLAKDLEHPNIKKMIETILTTIPAIEINGFPDRGFQIKNVRLPDGQIRDLHSF